MSAKLGFVHDPTVQDWGIEYADCTRLSEFIGLYWSLELQGYEKVLMFELIIASYNDKLNLGPHAGSLAQDEIGIRQVFVDSPTEFAIILMPWVGDYGLGEGFKVIPFANTLIQEVFSAPPTS